VPRLRISRPSEPGIARKRSGSGFSYRSASNSPVDAATRERIASLAIPPAWTDVWICPHENGHIQATGLDAAGRKQYLYHERWRTLRDRAKFERALELAATLPKARRHVTVQLRSGDVSQATVLAAAFRMLDSGSLRVGSQRYADENGSHGLSTLLCRHAKVTGSSIELTFPSKSGKLWASTIVDAELAHVVAALKRRKADSRLLAWKAGDDWHEISAAEINAHVKKLTGGDFTAKDFRTLRGTIVAAEALAQAGPAASKAAETRAIADAARATAAALSNTASIARKSYIDPRVIALYREGTVIATNRRSAGEAQLIELLK
jgi:DNA topoisomerase I